MYPARRRAAQPASRSEALMLLAGATMPTVSPGRRAGGLTSCSLNDSMGGNVLARGKRNRYIGDSFQPGSPWFKSERILRGTPDVPARAERHFCLRCELSAF